jgi:hypothetical protein
VGRRIEPVALRAIIEKADQPLNSMILLGINCGFGIQDRGTLPLPALDLNKGWLDFPRLTTALHFSAVTSHRV